MQGICLLKVRIVVQIVRPHARKKCVKLFALHHIFRKLFAAMLQRLKVHHIVFLLGTVIVSYINARHCQRRQNEH